VTSATIPLAWYETLPKVELHPRVEARIAGLDAGFQDAAMRQD
jgi:hypothetical protein